MRSRASRVKQADTGSPGAFSAPVRKKRGRRAPPSSRCLRGKKDDNVMSSDDAITEEDDAASPSSRKAKQQNHGEIAVGSSAGPTGQSVSVNEAHENSRALKNTSNVQTTAVKKTTAEDKTSRAIMDDQVFNAEIDSTSSDDESTEEVEDVKVCDICGDVGDEVKLAVCNRCNDGAEHTYCMRVMMEKVPDGEWFCEECQTEVELEKEKLEKPQVKLVTSKEESVEGKISKPFNDANSRSPCENEVEDETVGRKERNEANQGIDMVEDAKILPVAKQNIPEPGGLSMESYSRKGIPLPRESSFRLDKEKGKQPTSQVPILLGSNASKNQAPPLTGQLSKSTSFNNSKVPKVKQLVNEVPQKTKTWKEQLSCSMRKEGPTSFSTKSASFKKPKTCEPANKAKSSIIPPAEELSAMNLPVSRNVSNDRGTSILGCPSITGPLAFPVQSKAESAAQRLTTGNNISASSNSGHFTQFCGVDKLGLSAMKPLSERNLKDASAKRNKMSEATEKVTSRSAGQSDRILKCGPYHDPDQDLRSSSSTSMRTASTDYSSLKFKDCRAVSAVTGRSVPSSSTISSDPIDKSSRGFSPVDKTIVSTVPELDYIWQGDFELWRTGRSPELCDGFQAHLSCSASPKVLEVAKKFPSRVQLEELPRRNSWPTQFQQNGPTYENIGVFFFARDAQSYEHHYSKLVQNMLINDLALRGNIETAELIIFPSNILSKNSQRWNMFYFLWGVFKVKREDHWNLPLDVPISKCEPNLNEDPLTVDPHTSVLSLDAARNNETVWSSNSSAAAAVAQLRDNGNLVLADAAGAVVWHSFEHPTNTFVAEMRSGKDLKTGTLWALSSWRGADDPSPGDFRYVMDTSSGSPELHVWSKGRKAYRTGPWNGVRFSGIPEMTAFEDMFEFRFTNTADEVSYVYRDRAGTPASRVVLNETGVMQRMVWNQAAGTWSVFWSGPRDQCDRYGACGAFGVCNVVDAVVCGCVPGFRPSSPPEWRMRNASGGCARSTALQCEGGGEDGFYALRGVKLPETHGSSVDAGASLDECRRRCLSNCSCTAYAASDIRGGGGGSGCIQWFGELMDTRFVDGGQDLFVRLALSDLETTKNKKFLTVIAAVIAGFALLLLSLSFLIWRKVQRCRMEVAMFDDITRGECPTYHLETIRAATDGFRPENEIGRGGFGIVYKGQMLDGQEVAVKRLSAENRVQGLKEFKNEVDLIAKLQHRNLVRLLGCCIHCSDRILVYEYMSNKSLDTFIFDPRRRATLSWKTRMDIILGVARGLVYLHQDSRHTMIHRDLKAANVLLNEEMVAKISDFGIAKLFSSSGDNSQDSTVTERIVGTYGYMSPEYAMDGMVSFMQDVYSFGVLLLEIVSGRRNQRSFNLIAHAWNLFEENRSLELLDPAVRGGCSPAELEHVTTCIQIGLLCVQESPSQRPQMAAVIPMLSHQQAPGRPLRPVVCTQVRTPAGLLNVEEDTSSNELTITNLEGR